MKSVKAYLQLVRSYRFLWLVVVLHFVAIVAALIMLPSETRKLNNINLWIKPLKFFISVTVYLLTLPGLLSLLPFSDKKRHRFANILSVAMLVENSCIGLQAYRGQFSHYNISSIFNGIVFNLMGIFILLNTIYIILLFIACLRVRNHPKQSLIIAFRYALFLMLIASVGGGFMIAGNHHSIGAADEAAGMIFTNWNRTGGDLRVMHFFGLHALQILPLIVIFNNYRNSFLTVHLPALLLLALTVFSFAQALNEKPFLA